MIRRCPKCAERIDVDKNLAGLETKCPICESTIFITKSNPRKNTAAKSKEENLQENNDTMEDLYRDLYGPKMVIGVALMVGLPIFIFCGLSFAIPVVVTVIISALCMRFFMT